MIEVNCMTCPPMKKTVRFKIVKEYEIVVGGDDREEIIDAVSELYNAHSGKQLDKLLASSHVRTELGDVEICD